MSVVLEWRALAFPKTFQLDNVLRLRVKQLQEVQRQAALKVQEMDAATLIRSAEFWRTHAAIVNLSHPWSHKWLARRGGRRDRTPRSDSREFELCVRAMQAVNNAIYAVPSSKFLSHFEVVASIILEQDGAIRVSDAVTEADIEGHQVAFAPYGDIRALLNDLHSRYLESDLPKTVANIIFLASILNIHPLADGNGRCARAFFNALNAIFSDGGSFYIPLRTIIEVSDGGFEIRVRDAERNGNWLPLFDYFISVYRYILDELENPRRSAWGERLDDDGAQLRFSPAPQGEIERLLHAALEAALERDPTITPFLSAGEAGQALVMADAAIALNNQTIAKAAKSKLDSAIRGLDYHALSTSLYSGVTGVGFAVALLGGDGSNLFLDDLDDLLADAIASSSRPNLDIINGIGGLLTYGVARCKKGRPSARFCDAIQGAVGRFLNNGSSTYQPTMLDLGVGHGLAGVLMACCASLEYGIIGEGHLAHLRAGFDDLWGNCINSRFGMVLPNHRGAAGHSRVAWCYGSLGGTAAFVRACEFFPENVGRAEELLKCALSQFDSPFHGIVDASVCHGWAGNALLFDFLSRSSYLGTQRDAARCAAERCIQEVLRIATEKGNIFPFRTRSGHRITTGLLEGNTGVASALVAAQRGYTPEWAAMLGLSLGPVLGTIEEGL
jgi:hypothetical protein